MNLPRGEVSYERVAELSSSFMKNVSKKFSVSPSVVSIKGGIPDVCVCVCVCVCELTHDTATVGQ